MVVVIGDRPTASKAARWWRVMRLSRGAMTDRVQTPWLVLPSAMQREQPISLVRSRSASIKHGVAGSCVLVIGDTPTSEQGCPRVWRRVFEPWGND